MPAVKSQGLLLAVSSAAAATKVITAATAANPVQVTSSAHGYLQGQIITIAAVVGMTQLNGGVFVVDTPAANTFNLKGVDGTTYTAYASGGTASLQTMTPVGGVTDFSGFDGTATEIDTTNLQSISKEYLIGLQDPGNGTFTVLLQSDAGQALLRKIKASAAATPFSLTLSDGTIAAFMAFCKQFSFVSGGTDSALKATVALRITGNISWFA
jgi:hypothetical protein